MLNINLSNNMDIEYPFGDTFIFAVTEDDVIDIARRLRFQVSPNGNPKTIILDKVFYPENNAFVVSLTDDDTKKLEINKNYEYRLTYFSTNDERTTTFSGAIYVQWGAPHVDNAHTPSMPTIHVGNLTVEKRLNEHRAHGELDHPDGSVTAKKIANGAISEDKIADDAITGGKIKDKTISESKLNEDVIGLIASNKFDGYIATIADADGIDNRDNPHNVRIFRVGNDNGKGEGGILIVSGDTNTLYEHHPLGAVEQTYITHDGYVKTRHATNWDGYDGHVFEWSEWKSRYLTSEDVQELKAKTGYFSTSLAAGNVDYEIIAYDMTGIFGGLPVEPLSVLVSPDNTGIWESLSIVYADINGVRCKLNRSDFATNDLTANQINGYTGDKKDWFVYWYIGSDYDFNSEELNTGKYDISMAVPKFKVDEYGNISANSLKLKYDDRAIQIVNTAEGESIALPDSADAQLRGLKVMGKTEQMTTNGYQLFDASKIKSAELAGVKFTNNGDGSFTISKADTNDTDATTSAFQVAYEYSHEETVALFKAGNVYIKGDATISPPLSIQERWIVDGAMKNASVAFIKGTKCITITEDELNDPTHHIRFVFYATSGSTITAGTIKPMVYQLKNDTDAFDGTWEPYTGGIPAPNVNYPQPLESIGDDGSVEMCLTSGNLMTDWIEGGVNPNNGAIISSALHRRSDYIPIFSNMKNLVASNLNGKLNAFIAFYDKDKTYISRTTSSAVKEYFTIPIPNNAEYAILDMLQTELNTGTITDDLPDVMLEYGTTPTAYKSYKPIQTLSIPTPNGLPGVPVSSDGNYTDSNGQQWACDEKDYDRDVYVQRVAEYVVTGNENWVVSTYQNSTDGRIRFDSAFVGLPAKATGDRCLCTHSVFNGISPRNVESVWVASNGLRILTNCFSTVDELKIALKAQYDAGTPVTFKYPIATPIEKPLSADEINAYKALQTYKPNTSIHNSENAHMAVDYVADTKNYIDNKINKAVAELSAAILTQ